MAYFIIIGSILLFLIVSSAVHNHDMKRLKKKIQEIENKDREDTEDDG